MEITSSKHEDIRILEITGRLDANTAPDLEKELLQHLEAEEKFFLVNFAGLDYISSVGLRVLLMAAKKAKSVGGKVVLSGLQEHVHEVFEIAGFTSIFQIFAGNEEALSVYHG